MDLGEYWGEYLSAAMGLLWRGDCICCGRVVGFYDGGETLAGTAVRNQLCQRCGMDLQVPWRRVSPPVSVVPVFAAGYYGGAHRALVLALKEHLRPAAISVAGRVVESGIVHVAGLGLVPDPRWGCVVLLPAPCRRHSAAQRGGDVVTRMCESAARRWPGHVHVMPVAYMEDEARDSVGLGRTERRANVAAHVRVYAASVKRLRAMVRAASHPDEGKGAPKLLIVDDVCTTGATSAQFAMVLRAHGIAVDGVLVLAAA
ncbi:ComF family protein [Corynebacterium anserum]|uniref:ComF family protein n=1 Tax=Corynebacterium anserum TaxID=2684406 RepID=A0A7G7YPN8_9CORY|nr:ComF family protein [Corynebacterium anserum]MBC2682097.1 ComF family protein [Corynebacterium anserum]QNH96458.1 ComF family protein [Corynebacterium anserum]